MVKKINGRTPISMGHGAGLAGIGQRGGLARGGRFRPSRPRSPGARGKEKAVWFLRKFHFSIKEPGVIQAIQNNLPAYKAKGITLVTVAPDAELPPELERIIGKQAMKIEILIEISE
jgi:hypothetical protein